MRVDLQNKAALVTGAAQGIGEAIVERLTARQLFLEALIAAIVYDTS